MKPKDQSLMKSKAVAVVLVMGLVFTSCSKDSSNPKVELGKPSKVENTEGSTTTTKPPKPSEPEITKPSDFKVGPVDYDEFAAAVSVPNESIKTMKVEMVSKIFVEDQSVVHTNTAVVDQTDPANVKTSQKLVTVKGEDETVTNEYLTIGNDIWQKSGKLWAKTEDNVSFVSVITATSMFEYFAESEGSVKTLVYDGIVHSELHKFSATINPKLVKRGSVNEAKEVQVSFFLDDELQVVEMRLVIVSEFGFTTAEIKQSTFNEPVKIERPKASEIIEKPTPTFAPTTTVATTIPTETTEKPEG